jgi:urease accessory protein
MDRNAERKWLLFEKAAQKFFRNWARGSATSTAQIEKVFLLLFVHKKKPSPSLRCRKICRRRNFPYDHAMNFVAPPQTRETPAQRAQGKLVMGFKRTGAVTRIDTLFQQGALKARLPRPQDATLCEAVTLNISGGVAGGDQLDTVVTLAPGAQVALASQAAERIYRALGPAARIRTRLAVHDGARLDYLPQETILFDRCALDRALEIDLYGEAEFIGVETLLFGRRAMGETVQSGALRDQIRLCRDGHLVFQDMTRLEGEIAAQLQRRAVAGGANAVAGLIIAGPGAEEKLEPLRAKLDAAPGIIAGASTFEGIIFARLLAPDGASLRQCLLSALETCRGTRKLPRVWQG